jgi:threonyl-tRNA synthetase
MALRNEKISYKIRELSTKKIPVILVIGQQEAEKETVTIRRLGEQGNEQRSLPLDEVLDLLESEVTPPG